MPGQHESTRSRCDPSRMWQTALCVLLLQLCQAVSAQTRSTDVQALMAIRNVLLPPATSDSVQQTYNWTVSLDPCGSAVCGVPACSRQLSSALYQGISQCNWSGICCNDWYISGINLPPQQLRRRSPLSLLTDFISSMDNLRFLKMARQG